MKKFLYLFMSLLVLFPVSSYAKEEETKEENEVEVVNTEIVTLEACVDGDTAKFRTKDDEVIKARFLAVDTPETVHPTKGEEPYGKQASNYTCESLTNAKEIKLEYDKNSDEEDNYGRKLVWVFVDDILLQESLVSNGYAEVAYLYDDYKYADLLKDTQEVAKVSKVGIWSTNKEVKEDTSTILDEVKEKVEKKKKGFINKFLDDLLATIFDYINDLLDNILKSIENML